MPHKIHKSCLVVGLMLGSLGGLAMAYFVIWQLSWWQVLFISLALLGLAYWQSSSIGRLIILLILGLVLGWARGSLVRQQSLVYDTLQGQTVELSGYLVSDVGQAEISSRWWRLSRVKIAGQALSGSVLVASHQPLVAQRGDYLRLKAKLQSGFGSYQATLFNPQILEFRPRVNFWSGLGRQLFLNLSHHLNSLQSGLAAALLIGKRDALPLDFAQALQIVGLTHLVVVSGFHLSVIVRAVKRLSTTGPRWATLVCSLVAMSLFVLVTGLSASMWRAVLVCVLSLLAWFFGRSFQAWRLLLLVLCLMSLINPLFLWGDVSFYLSFGAFVAVMIVGPTLRQFFWGRKRLGFVKQLLTESLAVQILTWPLLAWFFGRVSLIMLVANLLVMPVVPLIMFLALSSALLGGLVLLGPIFIWCLQTTLNYVIALVNQLSQVPGASFNWQLSPWLGVLYYLLLIVVLVYLNRCNQHDHQVAAFNVIE